MQTTRTIVRGVAMHGPAQLVFIDTPGIFKPKRRLDRAMVDTAWGGARDADVIALLVDARKGIDRRGGEHPQAAFKNQSLPEGSDSEQDRCGQAREKLLQLAQKANELHRIRGNLHGLGPDRRRHAGQSLTISRQNCPRGRGFILTTSPPTCRLRILAAEITREKLFERLHQELPYISTVETEQWQNRKDGSARIEQTIYVERDSQKSIVLGKRGQTIKAISQAAREELVRDHRSAGASVSYS